MKTTHLVRTFDMLTISLAVQLECAVRDLRAARERRWHETSNSLWLLWNERQQTVWRAARALREAFRAARSLGIAAEFIATARRVTASSRKGGAR